MQVLLAVTFVLLIADCVRGSPKKYSAEEGGFQPSNARYYESSLPATKNGSRTGDSNSGDTVEISDRLQRFGYVSSYGNTGSGTQGYGQTGIGTSMVPMKLDLGGIALGAIIGLGAILIIPKLSQLFSSGHGYRSLDDDLGSLSDVLAKVDNSLEQHNIDSSSCMQRIICSTVHQAQKSMNEGAASTVDQVIYSLSNNSFFTYMLDGSSIKQAIDMGKQSDEEKCASLYVKCPVSKENLMQVIGSLLPA